MREKEKYNREILDLIRSMQNIDFITPEDIPNIDLYMDQVTTFMMNISYLPRDLTTIRYSQRP